MNHASLDTLATRLAAHLDCTQDVACRQIMQALAEAGQPLAPVPLARRLQMSQEDLAVHLACVPDTEFDTQGHIIGWGITLVPTQHQFVLSERTLFTWCAFDTVLFPPLLQVEAHVQSACSASGQPITFVATPEGIANLLPATSVLSLILPAARCDCVTRDLLSAVALFPVRKGCFALAGFSPRSRAPLGRRSGFPRPYHCFDVVAGASGGIMRDTRAW